MVANVKLKWVNGNLVFTDANGNELITFDAANNEVNIPSLKQTAIADIDTADATGLDTAQALANANKAKINAILAALRSAKIIASS